MQFTSPVYFPALNSCFFFCSSHKIHLYYTSLLCAWTVRTYFSFNKFYVAIWCQFNAIKHKRPQMVVSITDNFHIYPLYLILKFLSLEWSGLKIKQLCFSLSGQLEIGNWTSQMKGHFSRPGVFMSTPLLPSGWQKSHAQTKPTGSPHFPNTIKEFSEWLGIKSSTAKHQCT